MFVVTFGCLVVVWRLGRADFFSLRLSERFFILHTGTSPHHMPSARDQAKSSGSPPSTRVSSQTSAKRRRGSDKDAGRPETKKKKTSIMNFVEEREEEVREEAEGEEDRCVSDEATAGNGIAHESEVTCRKAEKKKNKPK